MTMKQTSVVINIEKWDTLKARGYKLQDIVDNAFNNLLDIERNDSLELNKEKNDLILKKKECISDIQQLKNSFDENIQELEDQLKAVKEDKKLMVGRMEEALKNINFKIKSIDEKIATAEEEAEEEKRLSEEKKAMLQEHNVLLNSIINRYRKYANKNPEEPYLDFFKNDTESKEYCKKYNMSIEDFSKLVREEFLGMAVDFIEIVFNNFR